MRVRFSPKADSDLQHSSGISEGPGSFSVSNPVSTRGGHRRVLEDDAVIDGRAHTGYLTSPFGVEKCVNCFSCPVERRYGPQLPDALTLSGESKSNRCREPTSAASAGPPRR